MRTEAEEAEESELLFAALESDRAREEQQLGIERLTVGCRLGGDECIVKQ